MSEIKITPLHDRVVVEPVHVAATGGIIVPDTAKEKPVRGRVISVGQGRNGEPMTVKSGDTILYGKHAGTEVEVEGKMIVIMRETEIFAII